MTGWSKLRIAWETVKDKWKVTAFLTFIFAGFAAMYIGIYPSFEEMMKGFADFPLQFIRGFGSVTQDPFLGYLNMELYQIFWVLIFPVLVAYLAASLISEEVEAGTVDMLLSNPVSKKRIVLEKFLGIIPLILIVTFAYMGSVYGVTQLIGEEVNLTHLFLNHLWSFIYFLAVASVSLLVSTIVSKKMKASIIAMAIIIGMYLIESITQIAPDYENIGIISLVNFYDPSKILLDGEIKIVNPAVLIIVTIATLLIAMIYFEHRDIT